MSTTSGAPPVTDLADGEWHRLHPASPLLRGGLVFLAIAGFVIANLRERLVDFFLVVFAPGTDEGLDREFGEWRNDWANDPIGGIVSNNLVGWALLGVLVVVIAVIVGFWLSWRMHTFRVTPEAVEVRSGILFRSHRSARLDRIQGINLNRPVFARLFGAAKLEVQVAGQSGNMQLAYLGSALADGLRRDLLRLASGARAARVAGGERAADASAAPHSAAATEAAPETGGIAPGLAPLTDPAPASGPARVNGAAALGVGGRAGAIVGQRVDEFLAPELDPDLAPPESVVHLPLGRVIGSTLLGGSTVWALILIGIVVTGFITGELWMLFTFVPAAIGLVSYLWSRITKSLRYSIAGTPDGVRIGYGLLSTANQTLPPGRIHAVEVTQWIFWRPFDWWSVRINVAGQSVTGGSEAAQRTVVLPVGTLADVQRVIALLLPDASSEPDAPGEPDASGIQGASGEPDASGVPDAPGAPTSTAGSFATAVAGGLLGRADRDGDRFSSTPRRAAWLHPFSWRRIGWAEAGGVAMLRKGSLIRRLALVPLARMQSIAIEAGPVKRGLRLAAVRLHTVTGPVVPSLPVVDRDEAAALFEHLSTEAVAWAARDRSQHWGREASDG